MKRQLTLAAVLAAAYMVFATAAVASNLFYIGPTYWGNPRDASSTYDVNWISNDFYKDRSGSDTMVTLIDNGVFGYSWHATVRNTAQSQRAYWSLAYGKKGYCRYYGGPVFNGSCVVSTA
jgi:hypothetical protein